MGKPFIVRMGEVINPIVEKFALHLDDD